MSQSAQCWLTVPGGEEVSLELHDAEEPVHNDIHRAPGMGRHTEEALEKDTALL